MMLLDPTKQIVVHKLPWLDWLGLIVRYTLVFVFGAVAWQAWTEVKGGGLTYATMTAAAAGFTTGYAGFKAWLQNEKMKRLEPYAPEDVARRK